jgi:hypothetical protein
MGLQLEAAGQYHAVFGDAGFSYEGLINPRKQDILSAGWIDSQRRMARYRRTKLRAIAVNAASIFGVGQEYRQAESV